jgi:SAM-dependent methyltransferase
MTDHADHFITSSAAARYAVSRPYFHAIVIERMRRFLKRRKPIPWALDAACGTGQSSVALKPLAARIVGVDHSAAMLEHALADERVSYVRARAEALPFRGGTFGLATVACGYHWFDRTAFLPEAHRVLGPRGWLVIYNNAFQMRMAENGEFFEAMRAEYPKRYPTPIRDWRPMTDDEAAGAGFVFRHQDRYVNYVTWTSEQLVDYLLTQTNTIAAVEGGRESLVEARLWLTALVRPFFAAPTGTFEFGGLIWYLRRADV